MENYVDSIRTDDFANPSPKKNKSLFKTDITLTDFNGDKIISVQNHRHNMTVLAGRLTVLEKSFGIAPEKQQRLLVTDMIPVAVKKDAETGDNEVESLDDESAYLASHGQNTVFGENGTTFGDKVNYFCIGNGGEVSGVQYAIHDVKNWETRLYNMVPFRCVPVNNDLTPTERAKYRIRKRIKIDNGSGKEDYYYAYYAKVFDPGKINSKAGDIEYVPEVRDSNPYVGSAEGHSMSAHNSEIFIQFDLEIEENEFKEFYRLLHNDSLTGARLTELGLISGLEGTAPDNANHKEIYDATLFAKLVHEPVFLSTDGSRRKVTYTIFA